jgi:hypothetical protein
MSSEHLASAKSTLKGNLGGNWNILDGASGQYQDLGIARRFGGAAAAYSLRDIGAMNGPVVNVRREPEDTTAAIDDEAKFSANQVQSGALEDWVNGKLETTLPADVATAAAAFSLRKVKASYAEDAVRIRRSSDSVEVDVAFDSDDKVSLSSAVTNVAEQGGESGQTSATTLGGFLTETTNMYTSNFATTDGFSDQNGTIASVDGIGGKDDVLRFTINSSASQFHQFYKNIGMSDETVRVQGEVYIPSSNSHIDSFSIFTSPSGGSPTLLGSSVVPSADQWVSFDITAQTTGAVLNFRAKDGGTHSITDSGGDDVFYLANVTVDATQSSAFVHTWYDQTDNNDAIQETSTNQPKIAENGTLFDHINFDGNTFMDIGAFLMDATDGHCLMLISNFDTDVETFHFSSRGASGGGINFRNVTSAKGKLQVSLIGSGSITTNNVIIPDNSDNKQLIAFTKDSNDIEFFNNGAVVADDGSSRTFTNAIGTPKTSIGKQANSSLANTGVKQRIYEVITYDTDETANRFKIESNINNYYGLYNDGRDVTGDFVNSGGGSFLSSSITDDELNFDYDPSDTSEFFGIQLANNVVDGDEIFISFNGTGGFNPLVLLRHTSPVGGNISGTKSSLNADGFQSFKLTCNTTNSNDSFLVFQTRANPSGSYNVTNLKISRIARNGFVETWYDQSGNGNDATQGTATNQPAIIKNGGLVTVNSKPAIKFDGTDNYFIMDSEVKFNSSASE